MPPALLHRSHRRCCDRHPEVQCGSSQSRRFRTEFRPEDSGLQLEAQFGTTEPQVHTDYNTPEPPQPPFWRHKPPGAFSVGNPHAQHTQLQPVDLPSEANEEFFIVQLQDNTSQQLPSIGFNPKGKLVFKPGFLAPFLDPKAPDFIYSAGLEQFSYNPLDRLVHSILALGFIAAAVTAFKFMWVANYNLALVLTLEYVRSRMSLFNVAGILFMTAFGKLWLFWLLFSGDLLDRLLERIAPPVRRVAWLAFSVWIVYLAVSPLHSYPLPFWGLEPGYDVMAPLGAARIVIS